MVITVLSLSELTQARKEREYINIAGMAVSEMRQGKGMTARQAILAVMSRIKVTGSSSDLAEIELLTAQMQ